MCDCLTFRSPPSRSLGHLQSVPFHTQCRHLHAQTSAARQCAHVRTHPGSAACTPTHTGTHTHTRRDAHTQTHTHSHVQKAHGPTTVTAQTHTKTTICTTPPPHTHTFVCVHAGNHALAHDARVHIHLQHTRTQENRQAHTRTSMIACTRACAGRTNAPRPAHTRAHTHTYQHTHTRMHFCVHYP